MTNVCDLLDTYRACSMCFAVMNAEVISRDAYWTMFYWSAYITSPKCQHDAEWYHLFYDFCSFWWLAVTTMDKLQLLSPHIIQRHRLLYVCWSRLLWIKPATKSTKFGSRYLGEGSSERDKILQIARGGLVYPTIQTGDIWPWGYPWAAKILKDVKKFL